MDTKGEKWHPVSKVSENLTLFAKRESNKTVYLLLYRHTFPFTLPRMLTESEFSNLQCKSLKDLLTTAEKLRYFRHKKALLQKEVAKRANINLSTYTSYESPDRDYYPIEVLKKIAVIYDVDVIELLDEYNLFLYRGQGLQLKSMIRELKSSKRVLAQKLNVHVKTITAWVNEKTRMPKNMYVKIFQDSILN